MNIFKTNGVFDYIKLIDLTNVVGGCSKIGVEKHTRSFSNHIYQFDVISQQSRNNNCGIECLRYIISKGNTISPERVK